MSGRLMVGLPLMLLAGAAAVAASPPELCVPPAPPGPLRPVAVTPRPQMMRAASVPDASVPSVSITVRVPAEAVPGQPLSYKILAENCSKASAHHVTVRVTVPGSAARYVRATPEPADTTPVFLWKLGTLASCEKREILLVVEPTGEDEVSCCARVQFEHGQCVKTKLGKAAPAAPPAPPSRTPPLTPPPPKEKEKESPKEPEAKGEALLEVRKLGPTEGARYDILTYTLEVRNVGRATAKEVVLRENLPKGLGLSESQPAEASKDPLTWNLGDIAAGEAKSVKYKVIPDELGPFASSVSVEAAGVAAKQIQHSLRVGQPALAVSISGPKSRGVGREATYHLTVSNPGDRAATGVTLVDDLDKAAVDMLIVRASDSGKASGSQVRWSLGTIAPGARRTVQVVLKAKRAGAFRNVCTATADRGLTEQAKAETAFVALTGLTVEIDPERDAVEMDRPLRVVVRVHNGGKLNEANVALRLTLPEGLKLLDIPGVVGYDAKGPTVLLPKRPIRAGEDAQIVLELRAEKVGPAKIAAEVTSETVAPDKPIRSEETVSVLPVPTR